MQPKQFYKRVAIGPKVVWILKRLPVPFAHEQQQPVSYQSADDLYCVAATYAQEGLTVPLFSGTVLSVYNYARGGSVEGAPTNTANGTVLCARVPDESESSKLSVSPCFLPNQLAGAYWVRGRGGGYLNHCVVPLRLLSCARYSPACSRRSPSCRTGPCSSR